MEWSILVLRNLLHLAIELGSGSLIHTAGICQSALADGLKDAEHTCGVYIGSKLRRVEAYLYVALSSQVVNLGRFHLVHHLDDTHRVAEIGIVKMEVGLAFQVGDTLTIVD